ncbi:hypothetical protein PYW07_008279 [Mythimna separata]|uniref:Peptidase S1 domain-containing protein n=1 Tax=Mythimna separata TaxID=271217 RepID=A0AAD7YD89_MYTSE|nr:hypothetical protein PYW07_008279 [Mythimna separata]
MFKKLHLFLFVLTVVQVSARYKSVEPDIHPGEPINGINTDPTEVSSSSSRIVSGWEAKPGQHPHHAALRMMQSNGGVFVCGGSIISKEWVLTTGHCTNNLVLVVVRVGTVSISDNNPENIFETAEWYNHPSFNNMIIGQLYSSALIKLQRPLVYTSLVKRIQLQSSSEAYRDYNGQQVYTSGHGMTSSTGSTSDVLRWVYLRAISNTACQSRYSNIVLRTTICAQYYNVTSQSNCFGDLGGPLVHVSADGVPTLIGISYFFNSRGCHLGFPTGFERPGPSLPWYKERTGIDFENIQEEDEDDTTVADTTTTTNSITTTPTTTTTLSSTTESESEDLSPEDFTTEDNTTLPPEDTEEKEEEEDSDSSESNEDDDIVQLLKRLEVKVKVKVALNKYSVTDTSVSKH